MTQETLQEVTQGMSIEDAISYLMANEIGDNQTMLGVTIDVRDGSIYIFQLDYWQDSDDVSTEDAMSVDLTVGKVRDAKNEEISSDYWTSSTVKGLVEEAAGNLTTSEFDLFSRVKYFVVDVSEDEHFDTMTMEGAMREIFKNQLPEIKTGEVKEIVAFERKIMELLVKINGSI